MDQLRGHSITYRIAVGPQQGRKVFTLQTLPDERDGYEAPAAGNVAGFSLHAGVAAKANQHDKLERLCRYITRPAISEKHLSLTRQGKVRYMQYGPCYFLRISPPAGTISGICRHAGCFLSTAPPSRGGFYLRNRARLPVHRRNRNG